MSALLPRRAGSPFGWRAFFKSFNSSCEVTLYKIIIFCCFFNNLKSSKPFAHFFNLCLNFVFRNFSLAGGGEDDERVGGIHSVTARYGKLGSLLARIL